MSNNRLNIKGSNFEMKLSEIYEWGAKKHKAVVYYPFEQKIERVAISTGLSSDIFVDRLPLFGKNVETYWPDQYEREFLVLKGKVLSYWDAMFPKEDKLYLMMYLNTGELKLVKYAVEVPEEVENEQFHFMFQDGSEEKWYARDAYEKTFILINPSKSVELPPMGK